MGVPITYNLRNLVQRKGTTLMTALGIGLTVAVLVTSIALTQGLASVFAGSGDPRHLMVLRKGTDAELTSSISADTYQIVRNLPGIAVGADGQPLVSQEGVSVVNLHSVDNDHGMNVSVRGILPVGLAMRNVKLEQGQMFSPGLRQVIVGSAIARRYPSAHIGGTVKFGRGDWQVVGVFSSGETAFNSEIWADLNQLAGDYDRQGTPSSLLVRTQSQAALESLTKTINDDQRLGSQALTEKEYYAKLTESGILIEGLGFSVAVIMAIGSAFAATNTMYAAVARRSKEVGTLRALGFSKGMILRSFILESVFLAMLGGILGVILALPINGLTTGVGNFQTFSDVAFKFQVTPFAIAVGLAFAACIGAMGGFLPAWAAARKDIVQAMREG